MSHSSAILDVLKAKAGTPVAIHVLCDAAGGISKQQVHNAIHHLRTVERQPIETMRRGIYMMPVTTDKPRTLTITGEVDGVLFARDENNNLYEVMAI